jgi:hypothetical protein
VFFFREHNKIRAADWVDRVDSKFSARKGVEFQVLWDPFTSTDRKRPEQKIQSVRFRRGPS